MSRARLFWLVNLPQTELRIGVRVGVDDAIERVQDLDVRPHASAGVHLVVSIKIDQWSSLRNGPQASMSEFRSGGLVRSVPDSMRDRRMIGKGSLTQKAFRRRPDTTCVNGGIVKRTRSCRYRRRPLLRCDSMTGLQQACPAANIVDGRPSRRRLEPILVVKPAQNRRRDDVLAIGQVMAA